MGKAAKIFLALAIICTLLFCVWSTVRIVKAVSFNLNCEAYIKRAADASTIEMAKTELTKAIDYAESNSLTEGIVSVFLRNPQNDIGFWYGNMKAAYEELDNLPENAAPLEKTNVLMKLRESLTDNSSDNGTSVTVPEGISVYPNNVAYFWWGLLSLLAACVFWALFLVAVVKMKSNSATD